MKKSLIWVLTGSFALCLIIGGTIGLNRQTKVKADDPYASVPSGLDIAALHHSNYFVTPASGTPAISKDQILNIANHFMIFDKQPTAYYVNITAPSFNLHGQPTKNIPVWLVLWDNVSLETTVKQPGQTPWKYTGYFIAVFDSQTGKFLFGHQGNFTPADNTARDTHKL